MSDMSIASPVSTQQIVPTQQNNLPAKMPSQVVSTQLEADEVQISKNNTGKIVGYGLATIAAGEVAKGVYQGGKFLINKGVNFVNKELASYAQETGKKVVPTISKLATARLKYLGAAGAGLAAFAICFKDADKDGKLDILEAFDKYLRPALNEQQKLEAAVISE